MRGLQVLLDVAHVRSRTEAAECAVDEERVQVRIANVSRQPSRPMIGSRHDGWAELALVRGNLKTGTLGRVSTSVVSTQYPLFVSSL